MLPEIKQRIEQIQRGEVPEGYRRTKDIGMAPKEWRIGKLSDVLHNEQRPVPKPDKPYWRLGVKSWAKGTFHAYVDDPSTVDMDELFVVKEKDLVVNITFAWEQAIALAKKEDEGLLVSHRFPTYMFDDGNVPDFYQAVFGQLFFKGLLDNISPGGAGRNRVLNRKDFLNLPCYIPPIEEQRKIAEILATCDRVIQLKQKLVDELKKLKKVCLEKMFPQKGSSVPEIRFSGFTAPWRRYKLGEIADSFSGGTPTAGNSEYYGGSIPFIRSAEIKNDTTELFLTEEGLRNSSAKMVKKGDILYALYGATSGEVGVAKINGAINQAILDIKPHERFDSYYIMQWLRKSKESIVGTYLQGGQGNLSGTIVTSLTIDCPEYNEQKRIGAFFTSLDDLITLHQRELETYQQKKKALMQLLLTGIARTI